MKTLEPFFTDQRILAEAGKDINKTLQKLQRASQEYQEVTGEKINLLDLKEILPDPAGYYRKKRVDENIKAKKPITLQMISEGFEVSDIESRQKLPDGFDRVIESFQAITEQIRWEFFEQTNGSIILSEKYLARLRNRAYFFAENDLQKRRLDYAKKLIALFKEEAGLLAQQAREAGIHESKIEAAMAQHLFHGPLPYCLRLRTENKKGIESFHLEPNPVWVVNGYIQWAHDLGLAKMVPFKEPGRINYTRWRLIIKTMFDGTRQTFTVPAEGFDPKKLPGHLLDPLRIEATTIDPTVYVIDNGKLIPEPND